MSDSSKESTLQITGMICAACSARIEKALNKKEGITEANVNLATEHATIKYNSLYVTVAHIIQAIEKLGCRAHVKENIQQAADYRGQVIEKQQQKFIMSAILSLPLLWTMAGQFSFTSFLCVPDFLMKPLVQFLLATPVHYIIGRHFYVSAYKSLCNKSANMGVLVVRGTAAYFYSVYQAIIFVVLNALRLQRVKIK